MIRFPKFDKLSVVAMGLAGVAALLKGVSDDKRSEAIIRDETRKYLNKHESEVMEVEDDVEW